VIPRDARQLFPGFGCSLPAIWAITVVSTYTISIEDTVYHRRTLGEVKRVAGVEQLISQKTHTATPLHPMVLSHCSAKSSITESGQCSQRKNPNWDDERRISDQSDQEMVGLCSEKTGPTSDQSKEQQYESKPRLVVAAAIDGSNAL